MSGAQSIKFSPMDITNGSHLQEVDPCLRLNDFLNNPRPIDPIPENAQLTDFLVEEGYGERERNLFTELGKITVLPQTGRERISQSVTNFGDVKFNISLMPQHPEGYTQITSLIAVDGLFLFGCAYASKQTKEATRNTTPAPLRSSQINRFKALADRARLLLPTPS